MIETGARLLKLFNGFILHLFIKDLISSHLERSDIKGMPTAAIDHELGTPPRCYFNISPTNTMRQCYQLYWYCHIFVVTWHIILPSFLQTLLLCSEFYNYIISSKLLFPLGEQMQTPYTLENYHVLVASGKLNVISVEFGPCNTVRNPVALFIFLACI